MCGNRYEVYRLDMDRYDDEDESWLNSFSFAGRGEGAQESSAEAFEQAKKFALESSTQYGARIGVEAWYCGGPYDYWYFQGGLQEPTWPNRPGKALMRGRVHRREERIQRTQLLKALEDILETPEEASKIAERQVAKTRAEMAGFTVVSSDEYKDLMRDRQTYKDNVEQHQKMLQLVVDNIDTLPVFKEEFLKEAAYFLKQDPDA